MKVKDKYRLLDSILMSWWDSLPKDMQKELREFYNETND